MIDFLLHAQSDVDHGGAPEAVGRLGATVDPAAFRQALAKFATGVTVVTTVDPKGRPRGFTANSFTSVSLDPPLVLVCVGRNVNSYPAFTQTHGFVVNVLAQDQRELSQRFASKAADKFAGVPSSTGITGSPILDGALAWFECRPWRRVTAGDHVVLIGEVVDFGTNPGLPLAYFGSGYRAVAPLEASDAAHP